MKPQEAKALIKSITDRGWVEHGNVFYPPGHKMALIVSKSKRPATKSKLNKTGWIDDDRNIRNKARRDMFVMLMEKELDLEVWPEFYFCMDREYRLDYAFPILKDGSIVKIGVEQNGGIWCKGNSGHSSGKGIQRDMDKGALAAAHGWTIISRSPEQILTANTIELIKSAILSK